MKSFQRPNMHFVLHWVHVDSSYLVVEKNISKMENFVSVYLVADKTYLV